jgi:GNAT superfamily N-acetyltransferase
MNMIEVKFAETEDELRDMRALQLLNLRQHISGEEAISEGFVMAEYSLEYLMEMHASTPAIIAKEGVQLAGYIMLASKDVREGHPLLQGLFQAIDLIPYKGHMLKSANYIVVGQVCVGKEFRGKGLFDRMYSFLQENLKDRFTYCACDIAQDNKRSLKAHMRMGFQIIGKLTFGELDWDVVLWDWQTGEY